MQISRIPQHVLFFWLRTGGQTFFKLLPDKVYADAITNLQYCLAKMQTKSDRHVKYGLAILRYMIANKGYT